MDSDAAAKRDAPATFTRGPWKWGLTGSPTARAEFEPSPEAEPSPEPEYDDDALDPDGGPVSVWDTDADDDPVGYSWPAWHQTTAGNTAFILLALLFVLFVILPLFAYVGQHVPLKGRP